MSQSRFFLLILTLFVFPSAAAGQGLTPRIIPPLAATGELKAGTWVRYILMVRKSREVIGVRLSALEVEGKAQWFELAITDPKRRTLIFKALVEGTLDNPKGVTKVIVQPPGQRPLLVPASLAKNPMPAFSKGAAKGSKLVAKKKVTVAGGTFMARHFRSKQGGQIHEAWFSDEVSGWPMIKVSTPTVLMEMADHGEKASSKIKGKPMKMDEKLIKKLGIQLP